MASTILIRRAQLEDAAVLAELSASTFVETFGSHYPPEDLDTYLTHTYTVEAYAALLDSADHQAWLAMDEDTSIGYLLAGPCSLPHPKVGVGDGEIKRFYVRGTHSHRPRWFSASGGWCRCAGPREAGAGSGSTGRSPGGGPRGQSPVWVHLVSRRAS